MMQARLQLDDEPPINFFRSNSGGTIGPRVAQWNVRVMAHRPLRADGGFTRQAVGLLRVRAPRPVREVQTKMAWRETAWRVCFKNEEALSPVCLRRGKVSSSDLIFTTFACCLSGLLGKWERSPNGPQFEAERNPIGSEPRSEPVWLGSDVSLK